jgi:hypothetical protein
MSFHARLRSANLAQCALKKENLDALHGAINSQAPYLRARNAQQLS